MELTLLPAIREAFSRVLETSSAERNNLLAELPVAVRAEVVSLLAAHESAGSFLDDSEDLVLGFGETIGPYRLIEKIGQGGMGIVYRARRDDGEFQREVAIKVVGGRLFAPEAERRFIAEQRILALLDHPQIVRMIDGGVWKGRRYLVMEFVSGQPVTDYCLQRGPSISERLRLFQAICSAIQYAHQHLIIHRDLKPRNILVTSEGQVKVLDFGIARLLEDESASDAATTLLHPMTLSCASPEQVREDRLTLATDIYSLSLLLYELLTGKNPQSTGTRAEIIRQILTAEPPPASKMVGGISPDLDAIVLKGLAKEAAHRYASAEEMSADVNRFLMSRPVLARPPSRLYYATRFCARNKALVAIAGALVVAVMAGMISTLVQSRRAERRFNEVRSLAHSLLFDVYDSISPLPGSLSARRLVVSRAQQYLDGLAREAANDSSLERELAQAYLRLGDVQGRPYIANIGDTGGALESYRKAQALLEREVARLPNDAEVQDELSDAYMDISVILMREKKAEASIAAARRAITAAEILTARYPRNATYIEKLAHAYMRLGQAQAVEAQQSESLATVWQYLQSYQKALGILEDAGPHPEEFWQGRRRTLYFYIGYALRDLGDRTGEVSYYQQALDSSLQGDAINRQLVAANPTPDNLRTLAGGLSDVGLARWICCRDFVGALRDLDAALEGFQKNSERDPRNLEARRDVADAHRIIGMILGEAGRVSEGLASNREALPIYEELDRADPGSRENAVYIAEVRARIAALEQRVRNEKQAVGR